MAAKFSEIKEGKIVLFLTSAKKYASSNLEILKYYVNKKGNYCVYITVSKPYSSLLPFLKEEKIKTDQIFFIDAITPSSAQMRAGNAVFVGSPRGLTTISLAATSAVKGMPEGKRFLFLDSVSSLMIYNNVGTVAKFSNSLIAKMKEWKISGAIISLEKDMDEKFLAQLEQFCDKTVEI